MEGEPKFSSEKSPESNESIEKAKELYSELLKSHGVTFVGAEAIPAKRKLDAQAAALKEVLKGISPEDCFKNKLPYHPTDKKFEVAKSPLPPKPDYPIEGNNPQPSADGAMVAQEQRRLAA